MRSIGVAAGCCIFRVDLGLGAGVILGQHGLRGRLQDVVQTARTVKGRTALLQSDCL